MNLIDKYFDKFSKIDNTVFKVMVILYLFLLLIVSQSCVGLKKTTDSQQTTVTETTSDTSKTSNTQTTTSEPIKDNIVINVPESNNAEVMRMFNEVMRQMNSSKTSGSNSYNSRYDEENKKWIIDFLVAQSQVKETETDNSTATTSNESFEQQVDNYIKKVVIPWWIYAIAGYFGFLGILPILRIIFPQLKILQIISSIKK